MKTTIISAREFTSQFTAATKTADAGPVVITYDNKPTYVLLSYEYYQKLANRSAISKPSRKRAKPIVIPDSAQLEMVFSYC